jgi:hypothetical protein
MTGLWVTGIERSNTASRDQDTQLLDERADER